MRLMANGERRAAEAAKRCTRFALTGFAGLLLAVALTSPAHAEDVSVQLSDAEAAVAETEAEVADAEAQLTPARARFAVSSRRAAPADRAERAADRRVRGLKADLSERKRRAAARIFGLEVGHRRAVDDHDEQVQGGIAFALAALVAAAIAITWGWFRATAAVAWLAGRSRSQAVGLCLFGGLALLIVGAAMLSAKGIVGTVGGLLALLAFAFPTALLLARHSAEVQRGRTKPLLGRERLPAWATRSVAAVMVLLFLTGIGSAIEADEPEPVEISAQLRQTAAATGGPASPALSEAEREAAKLRVSAARLDAIRDRARTEFEHSRRTFRRAEGRLASAQSDVKRYTHRLAVLSAREARDRERAERLAAEEAEAAEELEGEGESGGCDPNYTGCLDPTASDYDCAGGSGDGPLYTGPVEVIGVDHYGLDSDGDGQACEE
jgi:hypothetical protein